MKSLAETVARLSALRAKLPRFPEDLGFSAGQIKLPELKSFGSNPGALRARMYVPETLQRNAPLVVVLHGCTQTAAVYNYGSGWSQLADEEGFALLFPEQQRSNNPKLCFNWFVPDDIRRDGGEALSIRQMIETFVEAHDLNRQRIYITGLSAGGAMASVMLATYPEVFAGGAIIAGLPFGSAATIPEAFESMRGQDPGSRPLRGLVKEASGHQGPWPTISIWHGSADHTVNISNAEILVEQWREVHGLQQTAPYTEVREGYTRRFWCDAYGKVLIEEYIIAGMGHGTPLNAAEDGLGTGTAFMLDVGISSTYHIAQSWEIVPSNENAETKVRTRRQGRSATPENVKSAQKPFNRRSTKPAPTTSDMGVKAVIENALRSAGLMK